MDSLSTARRNEAQTLVDDHDAVNRRWLDYELDVGKLIDFPMMTDVRELDGTIVLPEATLAALEEKIAGVLDAGPARSRPPF